MKYAFFFYLPQNSRHMKSKLLFIFSVIGCMACTDGNEGGYTRSASYSECINTKQAAGESAEKINKEGEYLRYEVEKDHTLRLEIHNVPMNCAVEGVDADVRHEGKDRFGIHFTWWGHAANCMCLRTITYRMGKLEKGKEYHFTVAVAYKDQAGDSDSVSFAIANFSPGKSGGKIVFD